MQTRDSISPAPPLGREHRRQFLQFVRQVSPGSDPISLMLFGQILHAGNHLVQAAEHNLAAVGLSWAKFRLLMNLLHAEQSGTREGMQPSDLSELQNIGRNTVSALINSLERDGLVTRELHGRDRRKFVIRLTPRGRRMIHDKMDNQFQFVSRCFETLTPREREQLHEQITRLIASLEEQQGK